jgi:hypothetical protein
MNLELFGTVIFRLHPDYMPFYCAIIVGLVLLVQIYRNMKHTQKIVYDLDDVVTQLISAYILREEYAKDP